MGFLDRLLGRDKKTSGGDSSMRRPARAHAFCRNVSISRGMSSRRSRSGGTRITITLRR